MAKKSEAPGLLRALEFIAVAQRDTGAPYQTHVMLADHVAIAFDGVLAAGVRIDESLLAFPHTLTLLAALKKCDGALSVTQLDSGRLGVRSGKFRAMVPCLPGATLPGIGPDPRVGIIDNRIREALAAVAPIIVENSQRVITACANIRANSIIATDGHLMLEIWHGIDMPPDLLVPKVFINALLKIKKNLVAFGFSDTSFTVYFEDDSWLRTQLYKERWPKTDAVLARAHNPQPLPEGFFEAVETVAPFIVDNRIRLLPGRVRSHDDPAAGAEYEVPGLTATVTLNVNHLKLIDGLIHSIDFVGTDNISFFYGDNLRGALTQVVP